MNDCEVGTSGAVTDESYDVFLNHGGRDVRTTFVAHLEDALRRAGFRPFLDARSLMKGNPGLRSIDHALAMAKVHIAVVSKGYAKSKFCLNELVAIVRSGKPVVPVFYGVEPMDLRWVENGPLAEAFEKHKRKGRTQKKVQAWRDALGALAGITGFCLSAYKSDEAKLKREVVNEVARLFPSNDPVEVEQYRVGLEAPSNECIQLLDNMGAGVGILGVIGMGGIGKTTLAREIYNRFATQKKFRHMTFLEINRENLSSSNVQVRPTWSRQLRKQLLWDLLRVQTSTSSDYTSWFRKASIMGPVLIVIDDVHKLEQFEVLIPFAKDLHPGSRIIVTSRDRSIFNNFAGRAKVDHHLYDVSTLYSHDSNKLFNWHAFQAEEAPKDFKELAKDIAGACGGLPLALKVIGSSLFDKRSNEDRETIWPEAIRSLRQSMDVMDVLRWSYDVLTESEKHMFVDITCLFYYQPVQEAIACWKSCEDCTSCGGVQAVYMSLRNLINKNLVVHDLETSCLKAHDLLRDLGLDIGKRAKSHFINGLIAEAVIMKNQGTEKTMALNLEGSRKRKFRTEDFANMPNLHFLVLPDGCSMIGEFRCMPKKLQRLRWRSMSFDHIPMGLYTSNLVSLDFSYSSELASLWTKSNENLEGFPNLLRLNLSYCTSMIELPDSIGQLSQLQYLDLPVCKKLKRLPESIGQLKALKQLDLRRCSTLKALPTSIGQLKALELLRVVNCTRLEALPDTIGALSNLKELHTGNCPPLLRIPPSIGLLSSIERLAIGGTAEWETFPGGIGEAWTRLWWLKLYNCSGLESLLDYGALQNLDFLDIVNMTITELPESIGLLKRLEKLKISCERLQCLPNSIGDLSMLMDMRLSHCDNLKQLPETLGALTNLIHLGIECCPIRNLPKSIGQLSRLEELQLEECKNLQELPTSIRQLKSLQTLQLVDCGNIEAMGALTTLQGLPIWGSTSITKLPASLGIASALVVSDCDDMSWNTSACFDGACEVLEEDESGFLEAYHNKSSGLTSLLRGEYKRHYED